MDVTPDEDSTMATECKADTSAGVEYSIKAVYMSQLYEDISVFMDNTKTADDCNRT